jgi:bacterioferritin-associated ferredoxin
MIFSFDIGEDTETMIVCACTGTTDADIARLVREGIGSVSEVVQRTGAGRCCAPCREEIHEILRETRASLGDARPAA